MKKVLVIGSGGREHAIEYQLSRSAQVEKIYCAPGNAGIAQLAECVAISDTDVEQLLAFARDRQIDLCVVGPEASLAAGVADAFRAAGIPVFGHSKAATQIESSKEFAKQLMAKYHVPTAAYRSFADYDEAIGYVRSRNTYPTVLKYDGLAAGKGVVIAQNEQEAQQALCDMLVGEAFGKGKVVIEDYLEGPEFSFMAFVDHNRVYPMPLSQDHKRAYDGDKFNARFGDPETEVVLPLLKTDAFTVFHAIATGVILDNIAWHQQATVGVVLASKGYPGAYTKGAEITGTDSFDGLILHMGTKYQDGKLLTNGGRVLMCIAHGDDVRQAQKKVYAEIEKIHCTNLFYRKDIAHWAL